MTGEKADDTMQDQLMEAFLLSVQPLSRSSGPPPEPALTYCIAPRGADLQQYRVVPAFSFSDPVPPAGASEHKSECFSFVLTQSDGSRLHGYCRRYQPPPTESGEPRPREVACIITRHNWFWMFGRVLERVESTAKGLGGGLAVAALIKRLLQKPIPRPGRYIHVTLDGIPPGGLPDLVVQRPINTSSCTYDSRICTLMRCMPVSKAVMLFFLMLTERRIILLSNKPSVLSDCAHALHSLLYPFCWQHIFVPLLVKKMIDYVCAPMPFIIGMHISMLSDLKRMPMEEVVMVDLDRGRLRYNEKDIMHLPDEHFDAMVHALESCLQRQKGDDEKDWPPLAAVFLDFFLTVFSSYRKHVKKDGPGGSRGGGMDKVGFRKSQRKPIAKFLQEFERSQMYEVLFMQRATADDDQLDAALLDDPFERSIHLIRQGSEHRGQERGTSGAGGKNQKHGLGSSSFEKMTRFFGGVHESEGNSGEGYQAAYLSKASAYTGDHPVIMTLSEVGLVKESGQEPHPSELPREEAPGGGTSTGASGSVDWAEEWFGPSSRSSVFGGPPGAGGKGVGEGGMSSEEELERQTLFFKELNRAARTVPGISPVAASASKRDSFPTTGDSALETEAAAKPKLHLSPPVPPDLNLFGPDRFPTRFSASSAGKQEDGGSSHEGTGADQLEEEAVGKPKS